MLPVTEDRHRKAEDRTPILRPPTSALGPQSSPAGIYIHVPFLPAKCPYCDFYSVTALDRIDAFVKALPAEMEMQRPRIAHADTVYFGGGTPSLLSARQIETILDAVHTRFCGNCQCRGYPGGQPGNCRTAGSGRLLPGRRQPLNIGLQSTNDRTLSFLDAFTAPIRHRHLSRRPGRRFDNVGLDLIYAVPGQTRKAWKRR